MKTLNILGVDRTLVFL